MQARYERLLRAWAERRGEAGSLAAAVDRFARVTASYRPGLFHCCRVDGLPRTNNGPALVLRGAVRLVAGVVARARPVSARELAAADRERWSELRAGLERRRRARVMRCRFRRHPDAFLAQLESRLLQPTLPS